VAQTPEANAQRILASLIQRGFVRADAGSKLFTDGSGLAEGAL
jgi:DNA-binding IclR family transcriptional regulator